MRNFLAILFAVTLSAQASDIITATVVVTNAVNLNGTNGASLTLSSSTRIATNSVITPSTQWKASTNIATAAFNLLQHLRSYPFTGVQTSATNNGVVLTGAEGAALSLTVSNSWASVSYRTNAAGSSYGVVRIPYTIETPAAQAQISDGLIDWLNLAQTNKLSATATAMANFESVAALSQTTNLLGGKNLQLAHSALAVDNAGTNFVADFTGDEYRSITATNSVNLLQSTNRAAIRTVVLFIYPNGTNRNLTVPATWHALSAVDAVLTNTTVGIISLTANGTSETNVFYSYKAVP